MATIVTLQETELDSIDRQLVIEILGETFAENFVVLPAEELGVEFCWRWIWSTPRLLRVRLGFVL
ncbi:hypothetical protein HU200_049324 [Digitaria exilis]|uniref:Uncharacterized protein n=1 Tax=Digitaria exilis TaxID=1010633 RepID=A0A835AZ54_9POAL|nr:hypothetical protein HU200_049324 [Digitaria exilis]